MEKIEKKLVDLLGTDVHVLFLPTATIFMKEEKKNIVD